MERTDKKQIVLIVDDIPKNIQMIGNMLRAEEIYELSFATNGAQAVAMAQEIHPDLILLDVVMQNMDGFEACAVLKASPETRDIPIIFLTAKTETSNIVRGFELGAVDYVTKPFQKQELLARVRTHLRLRKAEEACRQELEITQRHSEEISDLLTGARAVLEYQIFEDAARKIFETCAQIVGATAGYVALLSSDGKENEVLFLESGGRPCSVDPDLPMPIRGLRAEAYRNGETVYDNDFHDSQWMAYMPEGHVRWTMCCSHR